MNIFLLSLFFIHLHVDYICGVRCNIGSRQFKNNIPVAKSAPTKTILKESERRKSPEELEPKQVFNPTKHRSWDLVFNEDCGMSSANRIIGGIDADLGQYPWIARIGYVSSKNTNEEPVFQCGGTLISELYIVTAAHCAANLPDNLKISVIRLGEHQTNTTIDCIENLCADEVVDVQPQNILIHKNYKDPQHGFDIALIRLLTPVNITEWISPICLPYGHVLKRNFTNEIAETAGWGVYDVGIDDTSIVLQTVKLPILNFTICTKSYKGINISESGQFCVGGEVGKDSCNGDSGGPLMKVLAVNGIPRYYLLGVVSFGSKYCGMNTMPAIYTKVTNFLEWILNNVKMYK